MFALAAAVLFVVAIFVLKHTDVWEFWMLLGFVALALHLTFAIPLLLHKDR